MEQELDGGEVIVDITGDQVTTTSNSNESNGQQVEAAIEKQESETGSYSFKKYLQVDQPTIPIPVVQLNQDPGLRSRKKPPSFNGSSTIEIPTIKVNDQDTTANKITLAQSPYPKAKSRLIEPTIPSSWKIDNNNIVTTTTTTASPSEKPKTPKFTPPITPKTPLITSQGEDDDDDEVYFTGLLKANQSRKRSKKIKVLFLIEFSIFVSVTVVLVLSKTVDRLENGQIWSLGLWKWCVLVLAIFCGRLLSEWFINVVVFLIEKEFLLKKKVLYFVYSLHKSVRVFIWLGLILLTWGLLINHGVDRSRDTTKVLNYITRGIASTLVGAGAWILKTLFVKILASSFHVKIFFDRIQENIFHQYVLQTLSGPPLMEISESVTSSSLPSRQISFKNSNKDGEQQKTEKVIDVKKLQKMKREKVSAWTMKGLIKIISKSGFSTLSNALDISEDAADEDEQQDGTITCEWEAQNAGRAIFINVAKHGQKYIEEDDLLRFMNKDDVKKVLPLFEGAVETGRIKKKSFKNWVVNVYKERKFLALSLKDTKTAIEELNKLVSGFTIFVLVIVWLLLMGIATTEVLLFISSQILLGVFMFGNSAKTAFEAILFVFIMHPFDVGDRCVVDGVQVVVEEVNILTTIFLRYDNEKIFYPNSILATKAISNFNRSPEMSDSVDFDLDVSTSIEDIVALKAKIKTYIDSKPQLWSPKHSVRVREIEDVNKMKMSLYVTHTINFQNFDEKSDRKSNLVLELKNIFEQLNIKYHLLPQQVLITYVDSASPPATTATRLS
ncbi:mechanosensitive ion channel protein 10-like [Rutidosis leptorrhynchoides]|uniref:mechanosensitive ion channel protein 10-like n=1 Tax=Rutidosis leptorrhynchoides TaxID=125765 RepID=UPI003A99DE9F